MRKRKTFTTAAVNGKYVHMLDCPTCVDVYTTETRKTTRAAILKHGVKINSVARATGEHVVMIEDAKGDLTFEVEQS